MRIDVSNLKKCFGENTAVNIGEYHIGDGELVGLVGNNGAGKPRCSACCSISSRLMMAG